MVEANPQECNVTPKTSHLLCETLFNFFRKKTLELSGPYILGVLPELLHIELH